VTKLWSHKDSSGAQCEEAALFGFKFSKTRATEAMSIIAMRWGFATTIFGRAPLWQDDILAFEEKKGGELFDL